MKSHLQTIDPNDRWIIRELAKKTAELAESPENKANERLWLAHNSLKKTRPPILVWHLCKEILPDHEMKTSHALPQYERMFRNIIHRREFIHDDEIVKSSITVPLIWKMSDWGIPVRRVHSTEEQGSWAYEPAIKDPADISKLRVPTIETDEKQTEVNYEIMSGAVGDILEVKKLRFINVGNNLHTLLADFRGLNQMLLDFYERPEWVEELMEFLTRGKLELFRQAEKMGCLELNNREASIFYTDELPAPGFDGAHPRLKDLWGGSDAQEFSTVSPEMFERFLLRYQIRLLSLFSLNLYGCCEPLTDRMEYVMRIPGLRRISISPWADLAKAAEQLRDKYVFHWRIHPGLVSGETLDPAAMRKHMRERYAIVKDCIIEVVLNDVAVLHNQPERLRMWTDITREVTGA